MHQRQRVHRTTLARFTGATLAAVLLAGTLTLTTSWSPLCPLYEPWSFLWIWNQCWDAPPNLPEG